MDKKPTLSVIMCNYNDAKTLPRAIEAIIAQSRTPDEFLIIDDGSTDESVEIIESYTRKYSWIKLYRNEKNMGFHYSANKLIWLLKGDFFYSGSANDYVLPGFFKNAMEKAESYPDVGVIVGQMVIQNKLSEEKIIAKITHFKKSGYYPPEDVLEKYLYRENPGHSLGGATIWKTNLLKELGGFRKELGSICDTYLSRSLSLNTGMIYLDFPCIVWIIDGNSISGNTSNDKMKYFQIIENCSSLLKSDKYQDYIPDDYMVWWKFYYEHLVLTHFLVNSLKQLEAEKYLMLFPKIRNSSKIKRRLIQIFFWFERCILRVFNAVSDRLLLK